MSEIENQTENVEEQASGAETPEVKETDSVETPELPSSTEELKPTGSKVFEAEESGKPWAKHFPNDETGEELTKAYEHLWAKMGKGEHKAEPEAKVVPLADDERNELEQLRRERNQSRVKDWAGEIDFDEFKAWVGKSKSQRQIDLLNEAIESNEASYVKAVVAEFQQQAADQPEPAKVGKTASDGSGEASENTPFRSAEEIRAAIKDAKPQDWDKLNKRLSVTPESIKAKLQTQKF